MGKLNELIEFIKNNPPEGKAFYASVWEKNLNKSIPDWGSIVKDKKNWSEIEKVRPLGDYSSLCKLFVKTAGIELAKKWFKSDDEDQRKSARDWMKDLAIELTLTPDLWEEFDDDIKTYVINYLFKMHPGELFEKIRDWTHALEIRHVCLPFLIPMGYIPSPEISYLRSIIKKVDDKKFLKILDEMIEEIKKSCELSLEVSKSLQISYFPTRDERELIAYAIDNFRKNGYSPAPLPEIYLSYKTPPLFVAYPELEEERGRNVPKTQFQEETIIPRNRERGRPETISIEEVLGCYIPESPKIILYARGIKWFAKRYNIDEEYLRMVVLVHETGHWITHLLPGPSIRSWSTELYKLASEEIHEGWAQLITYWVVDKIGGKLKYTFEELNKSQSSIYRDYNEFVKEDIKNVIDSLERLRNLPYPVGLENWRKFIIQHRGLKLGTEKYKLGGEK